MAAMAACTLRRSDIAIVLGQATMTCIPVTPKQSYVSLTVLHYCCSIAQAGQGPVTAVFPGLHGAVTFVSASSSFWVKTMTQNF
jgi:hypothetical protein